MSKVSAAEDAQVSAFSKVLKDQDQSKGWAAAEGGLRVLADKGNAAAQYNLGLCLATGMGVKKKRRNGLEYLRMATAQGHVRAMVALADLLVADPLPPQDWTEAARLYRQASEAGEPSGQFHFGVCLKDGKGVPADLTEAARVLKLAAGKNHAGAMAELAELLLEGKGVPQDEAAGARYAKQAADKGERKGRLLIAQCLDEGRGVPADPAEAARYGGNVGGRWQRLRRGSTGPDVKELQSHLKLKGHDVETDGTFGEKTEAVVRAHQQAAGVAVNGLVDPTLWHELCPPEPPDDWH